MSKAILVMDMPESCSKCDFVNRDMCCCGLLLIQTAAIESIEGYTEHRPTWCPLREVPKKIGVLEALEMDRVGCIVDVINSYNACIDEILGKDV